MSNYIVKEFHIETIVCPNCGIPQNAKVEHTLPWPTFIHHCWNCKYIIMESEWNKIELPTKPKK